MLPAVPGSGFYYKCYWAYVQGSLLCGYETWINLGFCLWISTAWKLYMTCMIRIKCTWQGPFLKRLCDLWDLAQHWLVSIKKTTVYRLVYHLGPVSRKILSLETDLSSLITLVTIVFFMLKITRGLKIFWETGHRSLDHANTNSQQKSRVLGLSNIKMSATQLLLLLVLVWHCVGFFMLCHVPDAKSFNMALFQFEGRSWRQVVPDRLLIVYRSWPGRVLSFALQHLLSPKSSKKMIHLDTVDYLCENFFCFLLSSNIVYLLTALVIPTELR